MRTRQAKFFAAALMTAMVSLPHAAIATHIPLLEEIDGNNFQPYIDTGLPLDYVFADTDDDAWNKPAFREPSNKGPCVRLYREMHWTCPDGTIKHVPGPGDL